VERQSLVEVGRKRITRMKGKLINLEEEIELPFYVMNDETKYWTGLQGGKGVFSDNFNDAKPLYRDSQFRTLKKVSEYNLEKFYL